MLRAAIDSVVFRIELEKLHDFTGVKVETLKHGVIRPTKEQIGRYRAATNQRPYNRVKRATSVFLIEHERGQMAAAVQWQSSGYVDIAVHGLHQYDEVGNITDGALQRVLMLFDLLKQLQTFIMVRVDYAIDRPKIPPRVLKWLSQKRHAKPVFSTTYFQPRKQRERENMRLKIMLYNKAQKDKLLFPLMRLEFALKSKFWPKEVITVTQLNDLIETEGIKTIKRWTGENVEVQKLIA